MTTKIRLTALLLALLAGYNSFAQDFSNKGKDFWVIYTGHVDGTNSRMALYITSDQNASGTVSVAGNTISFSVTANQVTTIRLTNTSSPSNSVCYNGQTTGVGVNKGIHIVSDKPVVVYAHILNSARSGSTLVLPTNVLGREYYVASYKSVTNSASSRRSEFAIVASEDTTTVEITPTVPDANNANPANVPFLVTLNKGDVYQFQSADDNDLTGSHIKSIATPGHPCKPIAVFSGSTWTAMGCSNASSGDNLYQQLMPFVSWGMLYYTAPFKKRSYDVFRILVQDASTVVTVNGAVLGVGSLINGRYYEFNTKGNNVPCVISSDKPICVFQYMITQGCDGVNSDPEMIVLNPVDQTLSDITVMSARSDLTPPSTNITNHYLNIIFKTNTLGSLRIDGNAPTSTPVAIPGTSYSYIQEDVTNSTNSNPAHRILSDSGFICIAYGYGNVESYGYNAGTNVRDLYQFVSIKNQYATVSFPAACKSSPFHFSMTFPYQPTQIQWLFNGLFSDTTINNPVADSSWVLNGKTIYLYKLPSPYTIGAIGTYPIKVLAINPTPDGCSGLQEINYDLQVYERPAADYSFATSGCITDSVHFTDLTNTNGRPAIKWYWDFDDQNTTTTKNATHLYKSANTYKVKFATITDIGCVSDTISKSVVITSPPVANFGITGPYCTGNGIGFVDSSVAKDAPIVKWNWDFGDGTQTTATTNALQADRYLKTGVYSVSLKVETSGGCTSSVTKPLTIHDVPTNDFSFGNACLPAGRLQFTNLSTISDGTQNLLTYKWDFGDGSIDSTINPTHNYTATGPYKVFMRVTSNNGCTRDTAHMVTSIYAQPQAAFVAPSEVCFGNAVDFADQSKAPGSTIQKWHWDFGDGMTDTIQNPKHSYAKPGTYTVTLIATSAIGCTSTVATQSVIVNALPTAAYTISSPNCINGTIVFTDHATANSGTITEWTWNYGDGSPAVIATTGNVQSHIYTATGTDTVSLQVKTDKGCVSTLMKMPLTIHSLPVPNFSLPDNCPADPESIFNDSTKITGAGERINSYLWSFGDPNASASANTSASATGTHRYSVAGNYTVTLTTISNNGCIATITKPFTLNGALPQAAFDLSATQACSSDSIFVINHSTVSPGRVVKLEVYWDYSNDPTNKSVYQYPQTGQSFGHLYPVLYTPTTKTYTIKVFAYSGDNCVNEAPAQNITIKAVPQIKFDTLLPNCANDVAFQLKASVTNLPGNGVYSGAAGVNVSGLVTPSLFKPGVYSIVYTYIATNGCSNKASQPLTIYPVPTVNAGPDIYVLEGGTGVLAGSGAGNNISYLWSPPTWLNNSVNAQPVTTPLNDITYTLTVTSANGCKDSDNVVVNVLKAPLIPNTFSPNGDGIHDTWEIKYLDSYPGCTVEIYNRYGQLLFQSNGYGKAWDGTFKGSPLPVGTYYYIINPKHGRKQMTGFVDIIR